MPFFDRLGARLAYTDNGAGNDTNALLLLHGLLLDSQVWDPLLPFLSPGRRVVALDLRGHGGSSAESAAPLADAVADASALLEQLRLSEVTVVGSSLGALIALELAAERPDIVERVVALGCLGHGTAVPGAFADGMRDFVAALREDRSAGARAAVPTWFGPLGGDAAEAWALGMADRSAPEAVDLAEDVLGVDPRPRLSELRMPVRYVRGEYDAIPREIVVELAALTPNGELFDLADGGHLVQAETPARVASLV